AAEFLQQVPAIGVGDRVEGVGRCHAPIVQGVAKRRKRICRGQKSERAGSPALCTYAQFEGWGSMPPSGSSPPFLRPREAPALGTVELRGVGVSSPISRDGFSPLMIWRISSPDSVSYS